MKNTLLVPLLTALSLLACRQEPLPQDPPFVPIDYTVLPPITQEGKNTFGCKVNGEVWVPRVELFVPWYDLAASLHEKSGSGVGSISCRLLTENQDDFLQVVFGPTLFQEGIYYAYPHESTDAQMRIGSKGWYITDNKDSLDNWVNLTLIDTARNIVSGEFQFTLYNTQNKNDKVVLSEGRFDMFYYPQ